MQPPHFLRILLPSPDGPPGLGEAALPLGEGLGEAALPRAGDAVRAALLAPPLPGRMEAAAGAFAAAAALSAEASSRARGPNPPGIRPVPTRRPVKRGHSG